jgi:poly-beta-1,6-N-acetyl-D-glucosamine biosynthesis protein PgaD
MTSLIINMPHLQSRRQRHGAMLLSLLCWAWFVMPLIIVATWLLGFHVFAQEIVWLGGWRSLVNLTGIALTIIAGLTAAWTLWIIFERRDPASHRVVGPVLDRVASAAAFGVEAQAVAGALQARVTTVRFTDGGAIATIEPEAARVTPGCWRERAVA